MSVLKKVYGMDLLGKNFDEKLYAVLSEMDFTKNGYKRLELGEGMAIIEHVIGNWWKPRYLVDENHCRAYEVLDGDMCFVKFTTDDIDWASIEKLPEKAKMRAQAMSARFPTFIHKFQNGIAQVSWQLNPDGRYYMDEDGFGMTSDEEITVYGYIDSEMNVLVKFQYVGKDYDRLSEMRQEAERRLKIGVK